MTSQMNTEKHTVLFIDDDPQALKIGRFLERHGFVFKATSDQKEALSLLEENHLDLVLIDLNMSPVDGLELTEQIKRIRPDIPVVVFTAYLRDRFWKKKVERAMDYFEEIFEKPFPVEEERIATFCRRLREIIDKHKRVNSKAKSQSSLTDDDDPFEMSFQAYLELEDEASQDIRQRAWKIKKPWFLKQAAEQGLDWAVVCDGDVVKTSLDGGPVPTEEELVEYGEKYDRIPFLFVMPPIVEEASWASVGRNPRYNKDDYYPTISCSIENAAGQFLQIEGDFDTGATNTCMSSDIVPISRLGPLQDSAHLGEKYLFTVRWINLVLEDERNHKATIRLLIYLILNWQTGPFVKINPQRQMLVGRDLLNNLDLRVILDSARKKTFLEL